MLRARLRTQLRIKRLTDQLESTENVVFSMARWVEFENPYTERRLRRISTYRECLGHRIGVSALELRTLRHAGILHDIGKIGVRQEILDKPGKLTHEEEDELRLHFEHGATMARGSSGGTRAARASLESCPAESGQREPHAPLQ